MPAAWRCLARLLALALLLAQPGCSSGTDAPPERIVLIVVDTLRRDHVSCYGAKTLTREIDSLAAKGQKFSNAYSSFHQTTVSMASLFTGRTPSLESGKDGAAIEWNGRTACGMYRFAAKGEDEPCFPASISTLPALMREAGYWTIGVTSNALLYRPRGYDHGFDDWVEIEGKWVGPGKPAEFGKYTLPGQAPERNGAAINAAVTDALGRRPKERLFLYVHYMDAHDYLGNEVPYEKGVADADFYLGQMLANLGEQGLLKNAVVVMTADHGERLGERQVVPGTPSHYGNPSFEQLLQVPLVVWPARFDDTERLVRGDDVFRMLKEIAGIPDEGKTDLRPGELYVSESEYRTYSEGSWKSFQSRLTNEKILINLESDPGGTRNVADEHPEVLAAHEQRTAELAMSLATPVAGEGGFTEMERERLKALGYVR
ncbi:MAG: sulfatase [Deltaproteobacteria bacterium]|nr:sulfatase [Deltaproteobacteria bacterium]